MIIFLFGEDDFRSRQKLKQLKEKFTKEIDPGENSFNLIDGSKVEMREIGDVINTSSLFTKKKMTVVENIFSNKKDNIYEELLEFLQKGDSKKDENILIFWDNDVKTKIVKNKSVAHKILAEQEKPLAAKHKKLFDFLSGQKYSQEFKALSRNELVKYIRNLIKLEKKDIALKAVELLVSLVGNNLWQLNGEIDKLLNYSQKNGKIEEDDIKQLVRGSFDQDIFALTDAISAKNKRLATSLLEQQYEAGLSDEYILNMFLRQFRILLQIREALDNGLSSNKIINLLKLHPFVVQKGINQARHFTLEELKKALNELVGIDFSVKNGIITLKTGLSLFIAKI